MSGFAAFCYGFIVAIVAVIAGFFYLLAKVRETSSQKLAESIHRIQGNPSLVSASAKLDPVRLSTGAVVCLGVDRGTPSHEPLDSAAKQAKKRSNALSGGLLWEPGWMSVKMTLLGATAQIFEGNGGASDHAASDRLLAKLSTSSIAHRTLTLGETVMLLADPALLMNSTLLSSDPNTIGSSNTTPSSNGKADEPNKVVLHNVATTIWKATGCIGAPVAEKNVESWLKDRVDGRVLFVEANSENAPRLFLQADGIGGRASLFPEWVRTVSCMVIIFPTKRETDRWSNVLSANDRAYEWRKYVRTLPSLDLLNLLTARLYFENTSGTAFSDFIRRKIERKLRAVVLPKPLTGHIHVASVETGSEVPLIHNISLASFSTSGEIGFDFDLQYRGGFKVVFAASFFVKSIKVPQLLFHVHVLELGGRVHVSIGAPPTHSFWIGFHAPPSVRLEFTQEVASHEGVLSSLLQLVPDLSETISEFVRVELFEDFLLPNMDVFELPNIGRRDEDDLPPDSPLRKPEAKSGIPLVDRNSIPTAAARRQVPRSSTPAAQSLQSPLDGTPIKSQPPAAVTGVSSVASPNPSRPAGHVKTTSSDSLSGGGAPSATPRGCSPVVNAPAAAPPALMGSHNNADSFTFRTTGSMALPRSTTSKGHSSEYPPSAAPGHVSTPKHSPTEFAAPEDISPSIVSPQESPSASASVASSSVPTAVMTRRQVTDLRHVLQSKATEMRRLKGGGSEWSPSSAAPTDPLNTSTRSGTSNAAGGPKFSQPQW